MEIVFIIKTTFNNSICIISCNWSCKVIRLPTLRVFCIAHTPWALTGRKSCWQRYLLTICYTTSYHRTTRIAFTPSTGLARLQRMIVGQCQSGTWKSSSASIWTNIKTFTLYPKNTQVLGRFKLCINTYRIDGREMAETEVVPIDMPDSNGEMTWQAKNYTQYSSYFMKITCLK